MSSKEVQFQTHKENVIAYMMTRYQAQPGQKSLRRSSKGNNEVEFPVIGEAVVTSEDSETLASESAT